MHKFIEEITLNTWPAQETLLLNGWLLRYASGYTKRSNSANPLYFAIDCDVYNNIQLTEQYFNSANLDTVFKITPFVTPKDLDQVLEEIGYTLVDQSSVMMIDLDQVPQPTLNTIMIQDKLDEEWLDHLALFNGLSCKNKDLTRQKLAESALKHGFATLYQDNIPVACGLGVIQHNYIGLYDIITQDKYRRQGFGEELILHLLMWGKMNGATHSFLQVVQSNEAAIRLYDKLGYKEIYQYWYRVSSNL